LNETVTIRYRNRQSLWCCGKGKVFFFEKKKQKTFDYSGCGLSGYNGAKPCHQAPRHP
jgi:hypothetical protein